MKRCFKCLEEKPFDCFYRHPRMGDGYLGKCKECAKRDVHQNYEDKREQYSRYDQERNKLPERKANKRRYERIHRIKHPDRYLARSQVGYALRSGQLHRLPCEVCGCAKTQAHHHDYSKPLDVRWLCFTCHREEAHGQTVSVGKSI